MFNALNNKAALYDFYWFSPLQRSGAWELLPHPSTLADTTAALVRIATPDLRQEQQRVREHRGRFRLHTRSAKQAQAQLAQLVQRWVTLPAGDGS